MKKEAVIFNTKENFLWLNGVYKSDDINPNDFHLSSSKLITFYYRVFHKGDFKVATKQPQTYQEYQSSYNILFLEQTKNHAWLPLDEGLWIH